MRICLYTETALPMVGGQEYVVDALARAYGNAGHETVVLAPSPRSTAADIRVEGYPVVRHPRFVSTWRFVELYRHWLTRLHRRFRYDIVHCHSVHPTGYLAVLSRTATRAPVVITSHGGDVNPANPRLKRPGARIKHAWTIANADALVSIGRFTTEGYKALAPGATVHDIPNGVNVTAYARPAARPPGLDDRIVADRYLLFLGRLASRKGTDVLVRAYAQLDAATRPLLVIAGAGEERATLERLIAETGLAGQVCMVGGVSGDTKTFLLQNARAVVIPSRGWEAFPLVLLEAYACGRPVIATRVPGLEDLVVPGVTGWLVEPESPQALAAAIREATSDVLSARGGHARAVVQAYDWTTVARRYLALFQATLATRSGGYQQ